jgi:hypothetical protein
MQLTPHLFVRAAKLLVSSGPQPRERRCEPRVAARGVATLMRPGQTSAAGATVYVHDLSPGGAGLLTALRVPEGERFLLELGPGLEKAPGAGAVNEAISLFCTAAYCRDLAPGLFGVGAKFLGDAPARATDEPAVPEEFREFLKMQCGPGPRT